MWDSKIYLYSKIFLGNNFCLKIFRVQKYVVGLYSSRVHDFPSNARAKNEAYISITQTCKQEYGSAA